MQDRFRPLHDHVLIRRSEQETEGRTAGGLYVPQTATKRHQYGTVVAAGEGKPLDNGHVRKMSVRVGDVVTFTVLAGQNVLDLDGEQFVVLPEEELLGIVLQPRGPRDAE